MALLLRSSTLSRLSLACFKNRLLAPSFHTICNSSWQGAVLGKMSEQQVSVRYMSTQQVSTKEKLKKAITEYGSTVMVFHITISLISLGVCYMLISSGVDVQKYMDLMGFSEDTTARFASGAGTFMAAYAVHKVFAPVRIMITLSCAPLIVRYLRNVGFLKKPPK